MSHHPPPKEGVVFSQEKRAENKILLMQRRSKQEEKGVKSRSFFPSHSLLQPHQWEWASPAFQQLPRSSPYPEHEAASPVCRYPIQKDKKRQNVA